MDIRQFFSVKTNNGSDKSHAGTLKKPNGEHGDGKSRSKKLSKSGTKRKISESTDSEENLSKKSNAKGKKKTKKTIAESDEEDPLPTKIRQKTGGSVKKAKKRKKSIVISSDEEDVLPPRLQKDVKNNKHEKEEAKKTPVKTVKGSSKKMVVTASDYFGSKPVEKALKMAKKRKERVNDDSELKTSTSCSRSDDISLSEKEIERENIAEKPSKKVKESNYETTDKALKVESNIQDFKCKESSSKASKKTQKSKGNAKTSEESKKMPKIKTEASDDKMLVKQTTSVLTENSRTNNNTAAKSIKDDKKSAKAANTTPTKSKALYAEKNISPQKKTKSSHSTPQSKSSKSKKSMNAATPETPKAAQKVSLEGSDGGQYKDSTPSSLERKQSGYRNFMSREGPRALGSKEIPRGSETCLLGKVFVITGVLESIERDDAVELVKRHGGKVTQAVSKKTNYIIVGRDPGMSKLEKSKQLGTKQISEDELFEMIRSSNAAEETKCKKDEIVQNRSSSQFSDDTDSQRSVTDKSTGLSSQAGNSQSSIISSACSTPATQTPVSSPIAGDRSGESLLWVDKYKPRTLRNIIGQQGERSNVNKLLRWLRNWHKNQISGKPKGGFFVGKEDGSIFKAALLSGPPGVGKTTSAHLVCQEAGFSFVEFNASDSRSKKTLEQHVSELLDNTTVDSYFSVSGKKSLNTNHALVMDEVDGMAGNEDRGGMQELINLIKSTKIPIICMCNDRNSQKVRSLANYCFDLRFQKPRVEQIKAAMMSIACKEGVKISVSAMENIVIGANQDIRQVLYNLSMWTAREKSLSYDETKTEADRAQKDVKIGPFDITRKIFSAEESSKMKIQDQFSLFFNNYSLIPLFSQENYLQASPYKAKGDMKEILKCVSDAAESYCHSDLVEKCIRGNNSWNLLPLQAFFSCVLPGSVMRGRIGHRIEFPSWLGKNSTTSKNSRILQELVSHAQLSIFCSKNELNLDYIPHLRNALSRPLINANSDNSPSKVAEVIQIMDDYNFLKEDWENIMDVGLFDGMQKPQNAIESKVKAAFTRIYNKGSHLTPYSSNVGAKKKSKKNTNANLETDEIGVGEEMDVSSDESDQDIAETFKVKKNAKSVVKKGQSKTNTASTSKSRAKGTGKGKNKK